MSIIGLFFPSSVYPNDKRKVIKESTQELGVDLAGVDILRKEGPFGKGIFGVLQSRISGF